MSLIPLIEVVKKLEKELRKYNRAYYVQNKSLISDIEYDEKKKKLTHYYEMLFKMLDEVPEVSSLRANYKEMIQEMYDNGIMSTIGFLTNKGFQKKSHTKQMYSLNNVFDRQELSQWLQRIASKKSDIATLYPICCETKIDGLSFSALYERGKLTHILTRGDGINGEDVTRNANLIAKFPLYLNSTEALNYQEFEVRGEIFIHNNVFEEINDFLKRDGKKPFSTTRNAASGILRQLKNRLKHDKILSYLVWGSSTLHDKKMHYTEVRECLNNMGFNIISEFKIANNMDEVQNFYDDVLISQNNGKISYNADGIVCKVNDLRIQDELGYTATAPRGAVAYKFSSDSYRTKLLDIAIQMGKYGNLTPIAIIEAVTITGTAITKATLHNFAEIAKRDIRIGDIVTIKKSGGVIPCICDVLYSERNTKQEIPKFQNITECPFCKSSLVSETDASLSCSNNSCPERIVQMMIHFVSKDCMNIEGIGKKQIKQLHQAGIIKDFTDILRIATDTSKVESILQLSGWQEESVQNLIYSIKKSYDIAFSNFIFSLCIPHIGKETAKIIASQYSSVGEIIKATTEGKLITIKGIGKKTIKSIENFFTDQRNLKLIASLLEIVKLN